MAYFNKCGLRKTIAGLPVLGAIALILYISAVFLFQYIPEEYPDLSLGKAIIVTIFTWFSIMTLFSIVRTCLSDPGYLSLEY